MKKKLINRFIYFFTKNTINNNLNENNIEFNNNNIFYTLMREIILFPELFKKNLFSKLF